MEVAMRVHLVAILVLPALLGGSLSARSDRFPKLNVAPLCHGITDQSALQLGFRTVTFDECMKAEQEEPPNDDQGMVCVLVKRQATLHRSSHDGR
jgi:hypothetical protein